MGEGRVKFDRRQLLGGTGVKQLDQGDMLEGIGNSPETSEIPSTPLVPKTRVDVVGAMKYRTGAAYAQLC